MLSNLSGIDWPKLRRAVRRRVYWITKLEIESTLL